MDIKTQVLDTVLRKYGKSDNELFSSFEDLSENDFKEQLNNLNLSNYNQRNLFFWELQAEVEKCVYANISLDDSERVSDIIAEAWNQKKEPKINSSVAISFLYKLNLKYPNSRKAFAYVCDGDLQSYQTFNSKSQLFIDLLVRFIICITARNKTATVLPTVGEVMQRLFGESSKSETWNSMIRLGFNQKKGRLNFGKMNVYKRIIGLENLVYAEGMKSILLEVLNDEEQSEHLDTLKRNLELTIVHEEQEDFEVYDLLEAHALGINTPSSLGAKENDTDTDTVIEEKNLINKEFEPIDEIKNEEKNPYPNINMVAEKVQMQGDSQPNNEVVSSLKQALTAVQTAIDKTVQLTIEQNTTTKKVESTSDQRLAIAEEEINRLKLALRQERERVAQTEEKAYTKVLQAIGGESSNYLLSDLFEESQGSLPDNPNISTGRLVNLFSSLSLAIGLEEYNSGYNLGDTFSIHKDELIKNYRIDGPIKSQKDTIQVKLMKYGWTMNGRVTIQPLVTEIEEEI